MCIEKPDHRHRLLRAPVDGNDIVVPPSRAVAFAGLASLGGALASIAQPKLWVRMLLGRPATSSVGPSRESDSRPVRLTSRLDPRRLRQWTRPCFSAGRTSLTAPSGWRAKGLWPEDEVLPTKFCAFAADPR